MNILFLAHRIPYPPNKGDKIRTFHQLEYLSRSHRVWCACFVDDPADRVHVDSLAQDCEQLAAIDLHGYSARCRALVGLARGRTITESYYQHAVMRKTLSDWVQRVAFDVVVVCSSSMAPYAFMVPARRRVLDLCDLDSRKWLQYARRSRPPMSWLYQAEGNRLAERERTWLRLFDATLVITSNEAQPLRRAGHQHRVHVVGNGVSLPSLTQRSASTSSATVGFVGVMDYQPNVDAVCWFARQSWPTIRKAFPQATFRIVGRRPTSRVRRLARLPGVHVVGSVEDVSHEIQRFDVAVAPLRIARGLQNKVLEAMAHQKPVVLTPAAAGGIEARAGFDYLVADQPAEFSESVIRLLGSLTQRTHIGESARRYVASHHCWDDILRHYEFMTTGVLNREADGSTLSATAPCPKPKPCQVASGAAPDSSATGC